jgi:hypothetical protein
VCFGNSTVPENWTCSCFFSRTSITLWHSICRLQGQGLLSSPLSIKHFHLGVKTLPSACSWCRQNWGCTKYVLSITDSIVWNETIRGWPQDGSAVRLKLKHVLLSEIVCMCVCVCVCQIRYIMDVKTGFMSDWNISFQQESLPTCILTTFVSSIKDTHSVLNLLLHFTTSVSIIRQLSYYILQKTRVKLLFLCVIGAGL